MPEIEISSSFIWWTYFFVLSLYFNLNKLKIMEKEFIPYEQALALKEFGFNEECFGYFYTKDKFFDTKVKNSEFNEECSIATPLYQQAFRWFREKTNYTIEFEVKRNASGLELLDNYYFIIYYLNKSNFDISHSLFKTYQEAELACLNELVEIAKNI